MQEPPVLIHDKTEHLVPASEITDGAKVDEVTDERPISPTADNGRPFPESRGVFRMTFD